MLELLISLLVVAVCVIVFLAAVSVIIAYATQTAYKDPDYLDEEQE